MASGSELPVVEAMFQLFDHRKVGTIARASALKIFTTLGLQSKDLKLPNELTLEEICSIVEYLSPKTENTIQHQLDAFHLMMNPHYSSSSSFVDPDALSRMLQAGGASKAEIQSLLESMMDWDDCGHDPNISCERYNYEITRLHTAKHSRNGAGRRTNKVRMMTS